MMITDPISDINNKDFFSGYFHCWAMYSLLFAMKTLSSIEGIKVNDPALPSQYKSPLLGQPSLS